jgi:hypothetical protein
VVGQQVLILLTVVRIHAPQPYLVQVIDFIRDIPHLLYRGFYTIIDV